MRLDTRVLPMKNLFKKNSRTKFYQKHFALQVADVEENTLQKNMFEYKPNHAGPASTSEQDLWK